MMSQIFELGRDQNEINNTGFGVNRYRCVHTPVLEVYTAVLNLVAVPLYYSCRERYTGTAVYTRVLQL